MSEAINWRRDYVGVREAARLLGVHENTIRNWVGEGLLIARKLPGSGYRRIQVASIQRLIEQQDQDAAVIIEVQRLLAEDAEDTAMERRLRERP